MEQYLTIYNRFTVKDTIRTLALRVYSMILEYGAENCVLLTVLDGGTYLANKLLDKIGPDAIIDLTTASIKVSSYHGKQIGQLKIEYMPDPNIFKDKVVFVIDDFCDSGQTTNELYDLINECKARDIINVTLLARKRRKLKKGVKLLYGIEDNTDFFYYGCGMDDNGKSRFADFIYTKIVNK